MADATIPTFSLPVNVSTNYLILASILLLSEVVGIAESLLNFGLFTISFTVSVATSIPDYP